MDKIYAPWRYKYIRNLKKEECIFCKALTTDDDRKSFVLSRGEHSLVIMNIYPYNNGHIMIAPEKHTGDLQELREETTSELWHYLKRWELVIRKAMNAQGFNIGMNIGGIAGAGIENHLHIHLVPRWSGDTNFMPVIGETKVVPMSLEEAYDLLRETYGREFND
ncbi:HIT domain-containing protein [candidate division WOR-3 bacterium]|nr:HIT domain-containing protein [candidate division WOR-3 bacterium]MCK4527068.1 HIT domain-containing protein [candidate division WOR-3 bacterium]